MKGSSTNGIEIAPSEGLDCCRYASLNIQHSQWSVARIKHSVYGIIIAFSARRSSSVLRDKEAAEMNLASTLAGSTVQDEHNMDDSSIYGVERHWYHG